MAQGVAFLSHLWSLLVHVPGSARVWKYAAVGSAGLAIFLGVLAAVAGLGAGPYLAWAVAFAISLFLNWQLNRLLTFADVASPFTAGRGRPVYLPVALVGGIANLAVYLLLLLGLRLPIVAAGLGGALAAMSLNFTAHRRLLRRSPRLGAAPGSPRNAIAERIRRQVPATTVDLLDLPIDDLDLDVLATAGGDRPPRELLRAMHTGRPLLLAEAPSNKPQARTDIGVNAWMAVPVVEGQEPVGLLVLQRHGRPFSGEELDGVLRALRSEPRTEVAVITPLLSADKSPN
jgi:putative flippase GtrA